jgi:hypothetical protein
MKRILLSLLCAGSVMAQTVSVDVQNTTATDLYLYQIDQGNITVDFKDGGVDDLVSGAAIFWYATNGLRSDAVVEIPVTVASATNRVLFPITANKFPLATPGSRPWTYGVEVAGKMHGDGRLYIKTRPAVTNATLDLVGKTYMDWTMVTNHVGTADYGPYQFTAGFAWTTNEIGRLVLTSTAGTPAWEDVTGKPTTFPAATDTSIDGTGETGSPLSVASAIQSGAAAGATAVQPATLAGYATTGTVAEIDVRVTGVETGKVDKTDARYLASLTNAAAFATAAQGAKADTAWQNPASATNWTWTSDGNEITLTGYTGPNDVVIPDMLDGLPVTGFGTIFSPGSAGSAITSVSGGANVTSIGIGAFYDCAALTSISLPSATSIGDSAFYDCAALTSISLPSATSIGFGTFGDCAALTSISLPSATSIGIFAFSSCPALPSVSLPSATSIGYGAFDSCPALTSVSLPVATSIGIFAFTDCPALTNVTFRQDAPTEAENVFASIPTNQVTITVDNPTATGWGEKWNGMPVVRKGLYADNLGTMAGEDKDDYVATADTNGWETGSHAGLTPTSRTITINDVTQSLDSNVSFTVEGGGGTATNATQLTYNTTNITEAALDASDFGWDGTTITIQPASATATPYAIAYSTDVTIDPDNGIEQRITEITGPMDITFPVGVTNLLTRLSLTIPPYAGTGVVSLVAGPSYTFITPLVSTNWIGTNAYTKVWYVSEYGTTNSTAVVARGSAQ